MKEASLEAFEGIYDTEALGKMVDFPIILDQSIFPLPEDTRFIGRWIAVGTILYTQNNFV